MNATLDTDIAIIGGGMWGALLAYYVTQQGLDAVVIEHGCEPAGGTTAAGLGTVCRFWPVEPQADLARRSNEMLSGLAHDLGLELHRVGCLHMPIDASSIQTLADSYAISQAAGVEIERLGDDELRRLCPFIGPEAASHGGVAYLEPEAFYTDTKQLTDSLLQAAMADGAQLLLNAKVVGATSSRSRVELHTTAGVVLSDRTVIAAGAWSRGIGRTLGLPIAALGLGHCRWESAEHAAAAVAQPAQCFHHEGFLESYFRVDGGRLLIGAEPADPRRYVAAPVTPAGLHVEAYEEWLHDVIRNTMATFLPEMQNVPLVATRAGAPTHTPDGLPIAGRGDDERFWAFTGCGGAGLMHGPPLARQLAALLAGENSSVVVPSDQLDPRRFRDMSDDELLDAIAIRHRSPHG